MRKLRPLDNPFPTRKSVKKALEETRKANKKRAKAMAKRFKMFDLAKQAVRL